MAVAIVATSYLEQHQRSALPNNVARSRLLLEVLLNLNAMQIATEAMMKRWRLVLRELGLNRKLLQGFAEYSILLR